MSVTSPATAVALIFVHGRGYPFAAHELDISDGFVRATGAFRFKHGRRCSPEYRFGERTTITWPAREVREIHHTPPPRHPE